MVANNPARRDKLHPDAPKPQQTDPSSRKSFLRSLRPLHCLSTVFGLWPFLTLQSAVAPTGQLAPLRTSRWCCSYSLSVMVAYSAFHLYINYTDSYGAGMGASGSAEVNFVSIVIDIYNRYSGLILFWLLHFLAFATQRTLGDTIVGVMLVDEQIEQRLAVTPNHSRWCRFICLHVTFIFLAIGISEWYNCIMYMSDFIPASEYCIFQCFITMLTSSTVEIQYMALVSLIKSRLQLINDLLVQLNAYGTDRERAHYEQFLLGGRPSIVHHEGFSTPPTVSFFLDEIASTYAVRRSGPIDAAININPTARQSSTGRPVPAIPDGDQQRWQKIKRLQHKIITVDQAPPSKPGARNRSARGPTQFPLLVASLMNSQSTACEHISMKIINDIKNLYTHLHLLSLNINKAFGAQLIFILMTLFVTLTTLLYYCTMKLFR
ncbi:hypothetical protein ZHAS_00014227 [Anopheles sinensis]|uniref:Gustatory receptor n=1 Tax=Anopheles sinensis TaxID=74873 RepID=A0A084W7M7_ANOSI|nr:hypothetical protein ZHAS_00014227 [Anopheles sinensis]